MIRVAIDGPSGAGKTTLAKKAAELLGYLHVDTGAMYRTIAVYVERAGVDASDAEKVVPLLDRIKLDIVYSDEAGQRMLLNGEDVTPLIRTPEISMMASAVSAIPAVRAFLLEQQRSLAEEKNVIMDGRDIGTVILPQAEVKIFLTATPEARALRRQKQLAEKGEIVPYDEVLRDVITRDYNDSNRPVAPLCQAEGAVLLDTTDLTLQESLDRIVELIREGI